MNATKTKDQKGNSIIPTKLFINEKGYAKIEICTATGKKLYDKRQALKEKDIKKRIDKFTK